MLKPTVFSATLLLSLPLSTGDTFAQAALAPPPPAAIAPAQNAKADPMFVLRPSQLLAIGAGVIGGVIVGELLFATDLGLVVGGVLGGYLANVWYTGHQLEFSVGTSPRS